MKPEHWTPTSKNSRILQLVLEVQFVLVVHLNHVPPKNNKEKRNEMFWIYDSSVRIKIFCLYWPRDLGCLLTHLDLVFLDVLAVPLGQLYLVDPGLLLFPTKKKNREHMKVNTEVQSIGLNCWFQVLVLALDPLLPCFPSFPAAPTWP